MARAGACVGLPAQGRRLPSRAGRGRATYARPLGDVERMQMATVPEPVPGEPPERPARETVGVIDPRARALLGWFKLPGLRAYIRDRSLRRVASSASRSRPRAMSRASSAFCRSPSPVPQGPWRRASTARNAPTSRYPCSCGSTAGGFVLGDLDTADPTCRALANRAGALVVSVDYRLRSRARAARCGRRLSRRNGMGGRARRPDRRRRVARGGRR